MSLEIYYNKQTETLVFPCIFNEKIENIPFRVTNIRFIEEDYLNNYSNFNQCVDNLPLELEKLYFGNYSNFNQSVDKLPQNLTHMQLGVYFNQSVDNLPINLIHLELGYFFSKSVDKLPKTLKFLSIGVNFNLSIDNLPKKLKILSLGEKFNQSIDNLPLELSSITFGWNFNKSIHNLPPNIEELGFTSNCFIKNKISLNIKKIKVIFEDENYYNNELIDNIPSHIEQIKISIDNADFKKYLKKIPFGCKVTDFDDRIIEF